VHHRSGAGSGRRCSWWPTGAAPASLIPVVARVFHLRFVGCHNKQKTFVLSLGNINNQLLYNTLIANQPVILYTSYGFEVRLEIQINI